MLPVLVSLSDVEGICALKFSECAGVSSIAMGAYELILPGHR